MTLQKKEKRKIICSQKINNEKNGKIDLFGTDFILVRHRQRKKRYAKVKRNINRPMRTNKLDVVRLKHHIDKIIFIVYNISTVRERQELPTE